MSVTNHPDLLLANLSQRISITENSNTKFSRNLKTAQTGLRRTLRLNLPKVDGQNFEQKYKSSFAQESGEQFVYFQGSSKFKSLLSQNTSQQSQVLSSTVSPKSNYRGVGNQLSSRRASKIESISELQQDIFLESHRLRRQEKQRMR